MKTKSIDDIANEGWKCVQILDYLGNQPQQKPRYIGIYVKGEEAMMFYDITRQRIVYQDKK